MRVLACFFLLMLFGIAPSFGAAPQSCPAGKPVTSFRLLVAPAKGGEALSVGKINLIQAGEKLVYLPAAMPAESASKEAGGTKSKGAKPAKPPAPFEPKGPSRVAILLASATGADAGHVEVLEVKPASIPQEWTVPVRASVVGLVYGPDGLSEHKIARLVKNNPELALKLTDYVEQTSKMEALVDVLSKYQQSAPGTSNLQASLAEFSSQYGVAMPAVGSGQTSDQQAATLLRALNPAFSSNPLGQSSMAAQSTGLAASVATFFMGPQFGLVAGGTVLLRELHTMIFPRAEFRAAFASPLASSRMDLCATKSQPSKRHTRVAYLWALPVPDAEPPSIHLSQSAHIPVNWKSTVEVSCATISQLKLVPRVRDWRLVSSTLDVAVPVTVSVGPQSDFLAIDLTRAKVPEGEYHLAAKWDWTPITVSGTIHVINFADYSTATLSPTSRDALVTGSGPVNLQLSGADFEFLNGVSLLHATQADQLAARLPFSLPVGEEGGPQKSMSADLDTAHLAPGPYLLRLMQLNGKARDIPVTIHPPNPVLDDLPVRANLGQPEQAISLRGTSLDHIAKITSDGTTWTLSTPIGNSMGSREREATIRLSPTAKRDALIDARVFVDGIERPMEISGVLRVVGPRPKIISARKSFASAAGIELHKSEIPARSEVSFAIQGRYFDARSRLHLECESPDDTLRPLNLTPGQRDGPNALDFAGGTTLFLSVNAGAVGESGCDLVATLTDAATGTSDPYSLGTVVRLPRIDKFILTDEKIGNSAFAGILSGEDLQIIAKTGWDANTSEPVQEIPVPVPGNPQEQTLKIAMPWPPPSPHAALYIWLAGESQARATTVRY